MTAEREAITLGLVRDVLIDHGDKWVQCANGRIYKYKELADAIDAHLSRDAEPYCYTVEQRNGLSQGAMCRTRAECEASPLFDREIDHIIPLFTRPPEPARDAKDMRAMVRRAMNAEWCDRVMADCLLMGTDYGEEMMEAALKAAMAQESGDE